MKSLFQSIKDAGIPFSSHESDLYVRRCDASIAILKQFPEHAVNAKNFVNQAPPNKGELWLDIPFAYEPFWKAVKR